MEPNFWETNNETSSFGCGRMEMDEDERLPPLHLVPLRHYDVLCHCRNIADLPLLPEFADPSSAEPLQQPARILPLGEASCLCTMQCCTIILAQSIAFGSACN